MLVVFTQNRKKSSEKWGETGGLCVIAMEKEQKLKKRLMKILVLAGLLMLSVAAEAQTSGMTIQQQIDWLQRTRQVHFVYDASLSLNKVYEGPSLLHLTTAGALKALFRDTGISYEQQGTYVMLKQRSTLQKTAADDGPQHRKETAMRTFTISGFVRDENGETLINATILDQTMGLGTMTNAYGFFSLTLPAGEHRLRCSYIGFEDKRITLQLAANRTENITLKENARLGEVVVTGDLNSPLVHTQTGKRSLNIRDIKTEFSLLSSPDVVKTLQRTSGVSEGIELMSGLYVHGGNNDENLFLIDGTPLYQVNHSLGLFSSFNSDMVKNVDFYKSGFPARYGGRLSSVIDVRTRDGDFNHFHGSYRIGLLDGSVQSEGPIRKGRTSYNIGLRRSWLDLLTRPFFAIYNKKNAADEDDITLNYFFHDFNAKLTNIFSERSRLSLSLYSGQDRIHTKDKMADGGYGDTDESEFKMNWGNFNVAVNWEFLFSPKLFANFTAVYTHNVSKYRYTDDDRIVSNSPDHAGETTVMYMEHGYRSTIDDVGYRAAFDYRPSPHHHVRMGHDYTFHMFHPQTRQHKNYYGAGVEVDTLTSRSSYRNNANEWNVYAEDEVTLNRHWSFNAGVNVALFSISGKRFVNADPRLAVKYQPTDKLSFKTSLTSMTQYVHKISNSFLELPTDYWVPTTSALHPMRSWQWAAGVYYQPARRWTLSVEGYYKQSRHLLQYSSWSGLEPPAERWDKLVMDGRGKYFGLELDAVYKTRRMELTGAYTLSWNKRRFDDFFPSWYYDKFDNRHKINLTGRWQLTSKIAAFAAWSYHSGNHVTVPTHMTVAPGVPDGRPAAAHQHGYIEDERMYVFDIPNNFHLPAYHRLDVGFDFHHTTKHGHERIWNVSLYNVYCHLNSLYVDIRQNSKGQFSIRNHAYIPVVPSFSYMIKF